MGDFSVDEEQQLLYLHPVEDRACPTGRQAAQHNPPSGHGAVPFLGRQVQSSPRQRPLWSSRGIAGLRSL